MIIRGEQSDYYGYLDAMMPAAAKVFSGYGENVDCHRFNDTLVVWRGDVARSAAETIVSNLVKANIKFGSDIAIYYRAAFIYLLTYVNPFSQEMRDVNGKWFDPFKWCSEHLTNEDSEILKLVIECESTVNIQFT